MHGEQSWVSGCRYAEGIIGGTLRLPRNPSLAHADTLPPFSLPAEAGEGRDDRFVGESVGRFHNRVNRFRRNR
jgi:hypothetical protein